MGINQFHLENQHAVAGNLRATTAGTVSEIARNPGGDLLTHLHELEHFGPAGDYGADGELQRFATVNGAVELGAVQESAGVMDLHHVGIGRSHASTFGNHLVLESTFGSHHTFGSLVLGQEGFALGLVFGSGDAILTGLFGLTGLGKFGQCLENGGIGHQVLGAILLVAFHKSLDKEVQIQIDGIAGHQLELGLVSEMGTQGIAILILFGDQSGLGLGALAQLITTCQEQGKSTCSNNHFFIHKLSSSFELTPIK